MFTLGKVSVKEEAGFALTISGQDADFFLEMHASGDWGDGDRAQNEQALQEKSMVLSRYKTLRGHEIFVATFFERGETVLFCPPNSVVRYVPLPDLTIWRKDNP